jgi:putative transposase
VPGAGSLHQRILRAVQTPALRARPGGRELTSRMNAIHERSHGTYGAPRVHAELEAEGIQVGRKRVARLMRAAGLAGVSRRKWITTTVRDRNARPAPDLVERNFVAPGPNRLWVADITYIPTWAGFLYLAVVLDAFSRRIVGWAMETHLRTELVLEALNMALAQRRPAGVIHHSDQGTQYTSIAFGMRCREAGVRPSMGSVGDCFDNAMCESFFATLECELLNRRHFRTQVEARMAVFEFIEGWYNPHRRHSALDYLSPINYERSHYSEQLTANPPPSTQPGQLQFRPNRKLRFMQTPQEYYKHPGPMTEPGTHAAKLSSREIAAPPPVGSSLPQTPLAIPGQYPKPNRETVRGLLLAVPVMVSVPMRMPVLVGWNVTNTLQDA